MSKQRKWFILFACLIVTIVLAWAVCEREPWYQGHSLSHYVLVSDRYYGSRNSSERQRAASAIQQIGTNAIPYFIRWIQYDEPDRLSNLQDKLDRWIGKSIFYSRNAFRANLTIHAFRALGPACDDAIPELARVINQSETTNSALRAIYALAYTGRTNALSPLVAVLTNEHAILRSDVAYALSEMGKTAQPVVPILTEYLRDKNTELATESAWTLGELKLDPETVVPGLMDALKDSRLDVQISAAFALQQYGPVARPAVPALVQALHAPEQRMRTYATNAILEIQPEALTNNPGR